MSPAPIPTPASRHARVGIVGRATTRAVGVAALTIASASGCSSDNDAEVDVPGLAATTSTSAAPTVTPTSAPTTASATTVPTTSSTTAPPTTTAPTTTAPATSEPVPTTLPPVDGPYYRIGDEGPEISLIQQKLVLVEFLDPGYTDGVFDGATNDAVIAFQGQYGLLVDGVVGPATDLALTAAAASVAADDG